MSRFIQCPFATHQTQLAAEQLEHNNLVNAFNILCLNFIYTIIGWAAAAVVAAVTIAAMPVAMRESEKKLRKVCTTLLKDETSKRKYFAITRERGSVQLHTAQIIHTLNMSMNV